MYSFNGSVFFTTLLALLYYFRAFLSYIQLSLSICQGLVPGPSTGTKIHGCSSPIVDLCINGSAPMDSTNLELCGTVCIYWKKIFLKVDLHGLNPCCSRVNCVYIYMHFKLICNLIVFCSENVFRIMLVFDIKLFSIAYYIYGQFC